MANEPDLTCYSYFDGTFEYIAPLQGDPDPMEPGNVLWPRNTTTVQPPQYGGGTIPVYNVKTRKWSVQEDHRGQTWFTADGVATPITRAGDPTQFDPPLQQTAPPPQVIDPPEIDPNLALRTSKVAFFRRTTEEEAAQFMADLAEASPRLKAIFDSVSYLVPGTPEYPALRAAVEARVSAARADELLAPSND